MTRRQSHWSSAPLALVVLAVLAAGFAACGGGGGSAGPAPVPTTLTISPNGGTLNAVGATLQLAATVKDQNGQPIASPTVTWSSLTTSVAAVSTTGLVAAVANGTAQIQAADGNAKSQVTVTVAQVPSTLAKVSGDLQNGTTGQALSAPLVVQVNDANGHPVAGVTVTFATSGGSVNPTSAPTNTSGQAQTTWTLGSNVGQQTATATSTGLSGSPVTFTTTANGAPGAPMISSITPDTLVETQSATITGTNFSATPGNDVVSIDGVQATVTAASTMSLTVTVPGSGCKPARLVSVSVAVGGQSGTKAGVPFHPVSFVTLSAGQEAIVQNPSLFCLQFRAAASGSETYVIGMSAPAEYPGTVMPFQITATGGISAAPPFAASRALTAPARARLAAHLFQAPSLFQFHATARQGGVWPEDRGRLEAIRQRVRAEAKIRQWEAVHLPFLIRQPRRALVAPITSGAIIGAPPAVGDTVVVRFPNIAAANPCSTYITVKTVARVVGSAGVWLYDVQNPTADSLTQTDIQSASNEFDAKIYASDTLQFGHPSDIDNNGRVIIVLTWQVNKQAANLGGFVWSGDLFPGTYCPQSNAGEVYYGEVPDSLNQAGTGARKKSTVVAGMPRLIAHEFTHVIQFSQRLLLNNGQMLESWEAEGQATFAEELAGDATLGNTSYQNYDHHVAFGPGGFDWYEDEMIKWAEYFGDLGPNNQAQSAPDLCTVYGNTQLTTLPCDVSAFYGASWILQRYVGDQFGPGYTGGLAGLTRDWVMKNPSLVGSANIAALLGINYDTLFARFATALALDDQNNGTGTAWVPTVFRVTSWNSDSIATWISTCCQLGWLNPPVIGFGTTTASRSVRGGSTAYTILTAAGAHPAAAFMFTDPGGATLGTTLRPTLWVARVQ